MIMVSLITLFWFLLPQTTPSPFEEQVLDTNVAIGYGLAIGDVDGDKKPDILLADKKQFVWYRNGDWKRFVMIDNLTASDNVCIAARDIDGDGKVEVAVGAQWNPGETSDTLKSGSVHFLVRPKDPTTIWGAVQLHHEPTVHRMKWIRVSDNNYQLIVVPLHGKGNQNGTGAGVKVIAYEPPPGLSGKWKLHDVDQSMHLTHNMELVASGNTETLYVGGKEGIKAFAFVNNKWVQQVSGWKIDNQSFGEIRQGRTGSETFFAGVQPMHGTHLAVYYQGGRKREVLDSLINQGHALAIGDVLGLGTDQIIVGWREPDANKKTGIKIFKQVDKKWSSDWLDNGGIACEDLQVADLNGDGKLEVIAAGRSSHNLKIYWNKAK